MALKVIGSGLGRTGTLSLKGALEQLGFGPCHHMVEVFMHQDTMPLWVAAGQGKADWDAIFRDYRAMVDFPGCKFYRELAEHYPDAKVLHSVRDPDAWFDSTQATIFAPSSMAEDPPEPFRAFFHMVVGDLRDKLHDRTAMIDYFRRHDEEVRRTIPKERLLVYEVSQGWAPLCEFLGAPVPDAPFPSVNSREEFRARIAGRPGPPDPAQFAEAARREARGEA